MELFNDLQKHGAANNQPDTSTLGDALFFDSFVLQPNHTIAEMHTAAQLLPQRKTSIEKRTSVRPASHSDGPGRPEAIEFRGVFGINRTRIKNAQYSTLNIQLRQV